MFARLFTTGVVRVFVSRQVRVAAIIGVAMTLANPALAQEAGIARAVYPSHGNAVTHWNAIASDAFAPTEGTNPMVQSRTFAILHAAIHDALNAIDPRFEPYTPGLEAPPDASVEAAVAAAAREVLVALVPDQATLIDAAYDIGDVASTTRTLEQAEIARFWYEDSPLGWNRITNTVVQQRRLDPWSAARAFALVHFAMADGFIAGFEAKYRFRFWRPVTAIREAAADGNPRTEANASWQSFLTTPPVPDYPSTHTVLGWAAAEVLIELFGDKVQYAATSLTLPGVTRHFKGFSAAADENGLSRIYAGIHFQHAVRDGRRQGRSVGKAVAEALEPVRETRLDGPASRR